MKHYVYALVFATGLLFTLIPLGVGAGEVNEWREQGNYPAQITAIPIGSNTLTRGRSVRVGAWTVSFTQRPVVARYSTTSQTGCNFISTYNGESDMGLVCTNAVVGTARCAFVANLNDKCVFNDGTRGPRCHFSIYTAEAPFLIFNCPPSLGLN